MTLEDIFAEFTWLFVFYAICLLIIGAIVAWRLFCVWMDRLILNEFKGLPDTISDAEQTAFDDAMRAGRERPRQ